MHMLDNTEEFRNCAACTDKSDCTCTHVHLNIAFPTLISGALLLAEELARMKEKDRLRKEYVEELRKRHEEEASRLETQLAKEQRSRREEQAARVEVLYFLYTGLWIDLGERRRGHKSDAAAAHSN